MIRDSRAVLGLGTALLVLSGALLAGCSNNDQASGGAPQGTGGPPPGAGGPGGGGMGSGGPGGGRMGGRRGGGPVAENASGEEIFNQKCQGCHGPGGKGGRAPELAGKGDGDLKGIVKTGKGKMPAFAGQLSDAQIDKVVAYVKGLK